MSGYMKSFGESNDELLKIYIAKSTLKSAIASRKNLTANRSITKTI